MTRVIRDSTKVTTGTTIATTHLTSQIGDSAGLKPLLLASISGVGMQQGSDRSS